VTQHRRARRPLAKARGKAKSRDPDFVMLLADPEIRLLMHADNVDEGALLNMLKGVSVQLRNASGQPKDRGGGRQRIRNADPEKYRRGVGIMLINTRNEIFIARRNDVSGEAWQMPQGGIDRGETPQKAAFRELKEEIGTDNVEIVAESKGWLYYDLPGDLAKKAWGGRWRGQRQKWFVMLFRGEDAEIDLATKQPEFNAWRWVGVHELESLAVSFKRQLYVSLLGEFAKILRD
jgi:putative (di)nucleoside polyphosphate hydrolase